MAVAVCGSASAAEARDLFADTWDAMDDLGRCVASAGLPAPRAKKVGIFYWTWHQGRKGPVLDNSKLLAEDPTLPQRPQDPKWGLRKTHYWGEPAFGYYATTDAWVLRRHAQLLSAAGVDVVVFDATNGTLTWMDSLRTLMRTWGDMRAKGESTPQFAYMLPFWPGKNQAVSILQLYRDVYKPGVHRELWFMWQGKPLIHATPDLVRSMANDPKVPENDRRDYAEIAAFFTFRPLQPAYAVGPKRPDHWCWLEAYPQHEYGKRADGTVEMCAAGVAQNHSWRKLDGGRGLAAMNDTNVFGRAYMGPDAKDLRPGETLRFAPDRNPRRGEPNRFLWGDNFAQQLERARTVDPDYLFITGWNEFIAGNFDVWQGKQGAFPDQYSPEFSRDIEPSNGILQDHFYCQFVDGVRKFKGGRPQRSTAQGPVFRDAAGDVDHRDAQGFGAMHYVDKTGRNDIIECFVSHDAQSITFKAVCASPITPRTDPAWMRLFISLRLAADDPAPHWHHLHFAVNRIASPNDDTAVLERCLGGWSWQEAARVPMKIEGNTLSITIPRAAIGQTDRVDVRFKWADNTPGDTGDILDFYRHGDAAPDGRFLYHYFEAALPSPAGQHCIYDAVPLEGAWEMSYCSNAWDSVAYPNYKGVVVAKAVPGFWENMVPALRAAGMKDVFRINPAYERQTIPMTQWAKCTTLPNIYGCFLYRRTFKLEKLPRRPAFLAFDCVRNQVHVWVNGTFVAFRQGFSTPFELPIPNGVLREGENEIVLAVSNNPNKGYNGSDVSGLTTRGLFEATGGIDGRLELRFAGNGIRDVYVTTAKDLKSFTVHVGDDGRAEGVKFSYEIKDGAGKVLAKGEAKGDFTLPTKGFAFWSPENPVRYTLTLATPEGTCSQKFGIRRLVPDGERMRLNGELTYLRGVTEHCYFPETVQLPRDLAYYRMITTKRKELGFNFLRFHTFVPPDEYLEAMDELGIMVHIESPNFVTLEEYDAIIRFARKHPCVVAYCTGNETWIDETAEKYLESVAKLVHAGTDSLFTPMSAMRNVEYMVRRGKDTANKPFLHVPSRMARLAAYSDYFTSYQLGAVSYNSLNGESAETVDAWGDAYCGKPRTMHETCIDGSFCDITLEKDYPKGSPITKEGVFSEVRRHLTERGLLDRAPTYVRNSGEWMRRIRKFTFEKVRASRRIVGYDYLGDIDSRWHTFGYSDGMMDEFYRLKHGETVENVRRYNSAAVLLCSLGSDFNFKSGEKKRVAFTISNFAGDAKDAVVKVSLVREGTGNGECCQCENVASSNVANSQLEHREEEAWKGEKRIGLVKNGEITELGEFEIAVPAVEKPVKYLLRASFAGGAVKAENEWEVYAFPSYHGPKTYNSQTSKCSTCSTRINLHTNIVRVVSNISRDDLLVAMERGERVLLLGKGPFKSLRTSFRIGLAGRTSGHYATIIKPGHPALEGMPHEGFCGWQFRRLMQNGAAVQLEAGVPFDPIIEVASSDKYLIRQAMLFEYKVGEGRLLVCSFAFDANDPATAWLRARLEAYAASDAFNPKQSLTSDQLRAVIDAPLFSAEGNKNVALNPDDPASYAKPKKK